MSLACELPPFDGAWHGRRDAERWLPGLYPDVEVAAGSVVLTFDDGPRVDDTAAILDVLATYGVTATFFVVGRRINEDTYPLIQRMVNEGHTVGNHTYHHDGEMVAVDDREDPEGYMYAQYALTQAMVDIALIASSDEAFVELRDQLLGEHAPRIRERHLAGAWSEIEARHRLLLVTSTGEEASPYPMLYARPPGGSPYQGRWPRACRDAYGEAVRPLGMLHVLWTHSTHDSSSDETPSWRRDPERLAGQFELAATEGGILLAHDRIALDGLHEGLERIASDPAHVVVELDDVVQAHFGCPLDALRQSLLAPEP